MQLAFIGSLLVVLMLLIIFLARQFVPEPEEQNPLLIWKWDLVREKPKALTRSLGNYTTA